ncbi:reverse transcriptase domain-containing protein [Bacillus paranthracis]|uniref:reverse transcriptase domain-containing protein n=1 Tax=Bacillus paranthracis TaxID=2026186 RepID=UPI000789FCE8|nr:reverse transcriptase domain-containing protein [Bacillus paranthracis]KYQ01864.1 RNA-directed DNA polymerase [Bacillus cereus]MDK7473354.1 reverse transcriptase domain-containing protein [Bacillus paranthracis]
MSEQNVFYQVKYIKTKNKLRKIVTYKDELPDIKLKHEEIAAFINKNFIPSIFSKAYVKNRSIYHNAITHMYNDVFIALDIKNYFNSIDHKLLLSALYYELNKRNKSTISKLECGKIISICSIFKKGLPLGLVTSPILTNVYMKEFDNILYGKLKKMKLKDVMYTRYADDLVISFKRDVYLDSNQIRKNTDVIVHQVSSLLSRFKLKLNPAKTKITSFEKSNHVKITGVNIIRDSSNHRKLSIGRKIKNNLFHDAIKCFEEKNKNKSDVMKIKGLESFVLSIEKRGYEEIYSRNMKKKIKDLGFDSLHDLINSLYYE